MAAASRIPIGKSWPYASTSQLSPIGPHFPSTIYVFEKVVAPSRAILGVGNLEVPPSSGWFQKDINTDDPVEVALAGRLQSSAMAYLSAFTS